MDLIKYVERKNTDCAKWDGLKSTFSRGDLLAMWVADMDFKVPDCVSNALKDYIDMGAFGYYVPPSGYYDAFIEWERAFNWLVQMLAGEGEAVAVMQPVYYPFMKAVENNGRRLVNCPLLLTETGYSMDYETFEEVLIRENVKAFIFSSPHNPVGRVWERDEIRRMLDICKRHNVFVISDEIHHDLIMSGHEHVPSATAGDTAGAYDDILVTLTAATKTFNLAAVQNSIVIIPDEKLRGVWDKFTEGIRITGGNSFGYVAVEAAYKEGRPWLEELLTVIEGNYNCLRRKLEAGLPDVRVADLEGTYLMWIDLSAYMDKIISDAAAAYSMDPDAEDAAVKAMQHLMEDECGIAADYGAWFGGNEYAGCIRLNLATRRENVEQAAKRIIAALKK